MPIATLTLKPETRIVGAVRVSYGYVLGSLDVIEADDFYQTDKDRGDDVGIFVGTDDSYGAPMAVILADSFESAYCAFLDSLAPITDTQDLAYAHGFDTEEEYNAVILDVIEDGAEPPDLADGYFYQSDGGIVCTYNVHLSEWHPESGVRLQIRRLGEDD